MNSRLRLVPALLILTFALVGRQAPQPAFGGSCSPAQKAAVLAALPTCDEEDPDACSPCPAKEAGVTFFVCVDCANELVLDGAASTCFIPSPPTQGWCRNP